MFKKAGIVVAASAAALLAVSPLAFAGDKGDGDGHGHGRGHSGVQFNGVDEGSNASGLIAVGEVNALNNLNVCPVVPVGVAVGDILGILGPGTANAVPSADDTTCVVDDSVSQENNG